MKRLYGLLMAIVALFVFVPLAAAVDLGGLFDKDQDEHPVQRWDQEINNTSRFTVLSAFGGAAVLDRETGLVWEKSPTIPTTFIWLDAQFHCIDLNAGGRTGWRLPTIQELMSLVDRSVSPGPTLPAGHPFLHVQSSFYWSATTSADVASNAWAVSFLSGGVGVGAKPFSNFVWCVRGGQGVDPQ